ncbi:MAG: sugar nucleotide-binding protein [Actinomycetota bacterium]
MVDSSGPPSGTPGPFVPSTRGARRTRRVGSRRRFRRRRLLFVTGSTGFVGRHVVAGPASSTWELIAPPSRSLDLTRRASVLDAIGDWRPDAVLHLAYRKGDRRVIVDGTRHVAEAAAASRARLVHVSTDLVFPGGPAPFDESDALRPIIDYGVDKRDAEDVVAAIDPGAAIVRTSLVYGTDRLSPAQVDLRDQLRSPARSTAFAHFTDEFRCPVHAADLAAALVEVAARPDLTGPLHVAGPELIDRHDLAVRFARHLGLERRVGAIRAGTIASSGLVRPGRIELAVGRAASVGITCRPISSVLP